MTKGVINYWENASRESSPPYFPAIGSAGCQYATVRHVVEVDLLMKLDESTLSRMHKLHNIFFMRYCLTSCHGNLSVMNMFTYYGNGKWDIRNCIHKFETNPSIPRILSLFS